MYSVVLAARRHGPKLLSRGAKNPYAAYSSSCDKCKTRTQQGRRLCQPCAYKANGKLRCFRLMSLCVCVCVCVLLKNICVVRWLIAPRSVDLSTKLAPHAAKTRRSKRPRLGLRLCRDSDSRQSDRPSRRPVSTSQGGGGGGGFFLVPSSFYRIPAGCRGFKVQGASSGWISSSDVESTSSILDGLRRRPRFDTRTCTRMFTASAASCRHRPGASASLDLAEINPRGAARHRSASMFLIALQYAGLTVSRISSLHNHRKLVRLSWFPSSVGCPAMIRAFMKKVISPSKSSAAAVAGASVSSTRA